MLKGQTKKKKSFVDFKHPPITNFKQVYQF